MSILLITPKKRGVCVYYGRMGIAEKDCRTAEETLLLLKIQSQTEQTRFAVHVLARRVLNCSHWQDREQGAGFY